MDDLNNTELLGWKIHLNVITKGKNEIHSYYHLQNFCVLYLIFINRSQLNKNPKKFYHF